MLWITVQIQLMQPLIKEQHAGRCQRGRERADALSRRADWAPPATSQGVGEQASLLGLSDPTPPAELGKLSVAGLVRFIRLCFNW